MKMNREKVGTLLIVAVMFAYVGAHPNLARSLQEPVSQNQNSTLTNKDVLDMHKTGLSQDIILAKIKGSVSKFDTSPKALQELKAEGVSDSIILAMVQAGGEPAPSVLPNPVVAPPSKITIPDGTPVEIELTQTVSSEELQEGNHISFRVIRPVEINGTTVIKKDAGARGHVAKVKKAGRWGKQGKLDWAMNDAICVDGTRIPLRFTQAARGESKGGTVAVAAVATTVLLGPLGLLWGMKKGKPAIIPAGNRYTAYVDGESIVALNMTKP